MDKRRGLRANNEVITHFLDKYRHQLQREENKRRKELKELLKDSKDV